MKTMITLLLMALITLHSAAQEINGRVLDEKKEPLISAAVQVYQNGILKGGTVTDYDGNYLVKPLNAGCYDVIILYTGYDSSRITNVVVSPGQATTVNFTLKAPTGKKLYEVRVVWKKPLIDRNKPSTKLITRESIATMPTSQVANQPGTVAGIYQSQRGKSLSINGSRTSGTVYLIDGVQVHGSEGIDMSQGVPNQYFNPSEESYKKEHENDYMNVKVNPLSTMSVDVDHASYTNVRRFINDGMMPPADAVRVEEMINYFNYDYAGPENDAPIAIHTELTECPWQEDHKLLHIGVQGRKIDMEDLPASNLVFLIDVSGSMNEPEKLPLLVDGMKLLVKKLRAEDKVSIVTYAGAAGLVLQPTSGSNKKVILEALDRLTAGGSTAGGEGIKLAYKVAQDNFIKGGNNRVLLATDGDFNVGVSSDNELEDLITKERETGVYLTCLGFGMGNYKDSKMEVMADKGNGNYNYIDNIEEAQKTLVSEFGGTLFTIAKDVKAQIEFNPSKVQSYRLVGYENRMLNEEDFKDDKKDAGDMGAGHTVTIIYEIIPAGVKCGHVRSANKLKYQQAEETESTGSDELATIKFRYKKPDGNKSREITHPITDQTIVWENASENTRFSEAVALFGMLLKDSKFKGDGTYDDVIRMAKNSKQFDSDGYRAEFVSLVKDAKANAMKTSAK